MAEIISFLGEGSISWYVYDLKTKKYYEEMRKEFEQKKAMEIARNFYNLRVDVEKISGT